MVESYDGAVVELLASGSILAGGPLITRGPSDESLLASSTPPPHHRVKQAGGGGWLAFIGERPKNHLAFTKKSGYLRAIPRERSSELLACLF